MTQKAWAFLAFNVYSVFLISAFQENTPYLFDAKLVADLRTAGELFDIKDWGLTFRRSKRQYGVNLLPNLAARTLAAKRPGA